MSLAKQIKEKLSLRDVARLCGIELPERDKVKFRAPFRPNFLLPDARFEACLVCHGDAGTGKSTIAEGIVSALGPDLVRQLGMSQICDPKGYHVPKLQGAAVNIGTELDSLEVAESSNFKAIVSGEAIEVRPIYGEPFTMRTTCKL